jgi:hypothetical protein
LPFLNGWAFGLEPLKSTAHCAISNFTVRNYFTRQLFDSTANFDEIDPMNRPIRYVWARRAWRLSWRAMLLVFFLLLILEVAYRYQWIDTYRKIPESLNPPEALVAKGRTILVMGDSFSANKNSWVAQFRAQQPGMRVINAAVSGTGIVQADIMAPALFERFQPDILLYQIYTGNDLADLRYPVAWTRLNPLRNLYWALAQRFRSLAWLNNAFGQWRATQQPADLQPIFDAPFDPARYTARERLLLQADPGIIAHQAFLSGDRAHDIDAYLNRLESLLARCAERGTVVYLLVLPHCAQVHPRYQANMEALGAQFGPEWHNNPDYPFLSRIAGYTQGRAQVLNPLAAFQAAEAAGDTLYYNNDPHLRQAGQTLLGDWVKRALERPTELPEGSM